MNAMLDALLRHAHDHADDQGFAELPLPGLGLMRSFTPTDKIHALYRPLLCLVLQGAKQVVMGHEMLAFEAGQSLVVSADTPVIGRVTRASAQAPYLALALTFDMALMRDLALEIGAVSPAPVPSPRAEVALTDQRVAQCAHRLIELMHTPQDRAILAPGLLRELHYRVLTGPQGQRIRAAAMPDSHAHRIGRVVALLRRDFTAALSIETLADVAGMSPSSFHQHFRAVTSLTPIQFRQHLRLLEGRRLMLAEGAGATEAAFAVGYESLSQFTREYGRLFGTPPGRDRAARRRAA